MSMYFCVLEHKKTKQELNKSPSLEKKKNIMCSLKLKEDYQLVFMAAKKSFK